MRLSHQIEFGQNSVVSLLDPRDFVNLPSSETFVRSEKTQGPIEQLVHRVDLVQAPQHLLPIPTRQRQRRKLDFVFSESDFRSGRFSSLDLCPRSPYDPAYRVRDKVPDVNDDLQRRKEDLGHDDDVDDDDPTISKKKRKEKKKESLLIVF